MECDQLSSTKPIDLKMIDFKKLHKIDIRVPLSRNGRQSRVSIGKFARKISRSKALKKLQVITVLGYQCKGSNGGKRWAEKKTSLRISSQLLRDWIPCMVWKQRYL
jgi:hypothetical protein